MYISIDSRTNHLYFVINNLKINIIIVFKFNIILIRLIGSIDCNVLASIFFFYI